MDKDRARERLKKMVQLGFRQLGDPYYQGFAAQIAFFMILSVVPAVIVTTQFLGLLNIQRLDFLDNAITEYVTPRMASMIRSLLRNSSSPGNDIILIIVAVWASSRAHFSLMRIANYTYSSSRSTGNFFRERLRSIRIMIMFMLTLTFVIVVLVYGEKILFVVFGSIARDYEITRVWTYFRWPLAAVLYFLVVFYLYYAMPNVKMTARELLPGTVFGSTGMIIVTLIYAWYTDYIVRYNIIYGSLSSIAGLLFWFYFLSWVLVLGILINKVVKETKGAPEIGNY